MQKVTYLLLALYIFSNCTNNDKQEIDYTIVKFDYLTPGCQPENDACLMVNMTYPRFNQGDSIARHLANRIIKNSILDNIGMGDVEATVELGIEESVEALNKELAELKKEFKNYGTGWQVDIASKELFRSDSILVLEINSMTYFGGAHPNHGTRFYNFNRKKGNMLPLSTIIEDFSSFNSKAETAFRKAYVINDTTSLKEAGFEFMGNRFSLPANYAFLGDSIRLYYNPYEIAPYAAGDFEVTVSLK